jgi:hypothetical protein
MCGGRIEEKETGMLPCEDGANGERRGEMRTRGLEKKACTFSSESEDEDE